jgi:hypothetical protein
VSGLGKYNWIKKGKLVASGWADIRPFGYREGTETVKVEMFRAVEAVAYQLWLECEFLNSDGDGGIHPGYGAQGQVRGG